jgi:hypothetical protein
MRYIFQCVELLERGARELDDKLPINNRLSLIVTDNIVELMFHFRCKAIFRRDRLFAAMGKGRFTRAYEARTLGPRFEDKLNFLRAEGEVTAHEAALISICHRYRNEAYHVGLNHEDIIYPLAWEYHSLACDLFGRLRRDSRGASSNDRITPTLAKYIGEGHKYPMRVMLDLDQAALAKALSISKRTLDERLSEVLAQERLRRIASLEESLEFLVRDDPRKLSVSAMVRDIQWQADLFKDIPLEVEERTKEYTKHILKKRGEMERAWVPKFDRFPFAAWKRRAVAIRGKAPSSAVQTYENLKRDMEYVDGALTEAAVQLDMYIQHQIDLARGK